MKGVHSIRDQGIISLWAVSQSVELLRKVSGTITEAFPEAPNCRRVPEPCPYGFQLVKLGTSGISRLTKLTQRP